MNSKKTKHKNRPNKTPNPNPPQKIDINSKSDVNIEDLPEECVIKDDERVPEIVSEIVTPPVIELQELGADSPKKPKRSKGKKKKHDNIGDNLEAKVLDLVKDEVSIANESEKKLINVPDVTPNIRKKKNKKKPHEQQTEETILPEQETSYVEILKTVEMISTEATVVNPLQTEIAKEESKPLKKKTKKKKQRSDSERSDKSEDNICCTTVFQNLLDVNDEIPDELEKTEDVQTTKKDSEISAFSVNKDLLEMENATNTLKCVDEVVFVVNAEETPISDIQNSEEKPKDEGKSKKKHKKDKKLPLKEQTEEQKSHLGKLEAVNVIENICPAKSADIISTGNVIFDEVKQIEESEKSMDLSEFTESAKPKAKIAKPVEKKHKAKQEVQSEKSFSEVIAGNETAIDDEKAEEIKLETIKMQEEEFLTSDFTDTIESESSLKENVPTMKSLEHINTPYPIMGKNKKRVPKEPVETAFETQKSTIEMNHSELSDAKEIVKPLTEIMFPMAQKSVHEESLQSLAGDLSNITFIPPLSITTDLKETIEQIEPVTDYPQQQHDRVVTSETKTGKKKKKVPKIPAQAENKKEVEELKTKITEPEVLQSLTSEEKSEQENNKESVNLVDLTIVDIEISSIKADEPEGSGCNVTPDIHYPRALSQQLIDDNNNMVIQEIIGIEEIKSNVSLIIPDVPIVEGFGETPIVTPEFVASGIRVTEIKTKIPIEKEEKTDLKSKMMEVNQDMEELRLSIERSLAEFTAMEKREKDMEKTFEEAQIKPDGTKIPETEEIECELPITESTDTKTIPKEVLTEGSVTIETPPICPARRDHKGKGKSKKKGKQDTNKPTSTAATDRKETSQDAKKEEKTEKTEQKTETTKEKGKQQCSTISEKDNVLISGTDSFQDPEDQLNYEPIDNFEDALTSSVDDVNKTFEIIANEVDESNKLFQQQLAVNKPKINVTAPVEDTGTTTKEKEKANPVSPPKNLLGHPDIPVPSNKTDYKKEKNKTPNTKQAKVKIKDSVDVEAPKLSKESQTESKSIKKDADKAVKESIAHVTNDDEEYVYKYSFRKVFLQSSCHVCKKELGQVRVPCNFCNLVFYCSPKHKDEDWIQHQALCFAVSTIVHLKDQKHIYADAKSVTGHNYRLIRMQMIVSCEKVLKRRLVPWEQEALLYPRICADVACREWQQSKLKDCEGCGQISYCSKNPEHLPKSHQRWCKSYNLYQKLVSYQQTKGRLEPKLPSRVMTEQFVIPTKINEVLASMFEEKIDMNDIQYAALTQLATAPLTAAYCHQIYRNKVNNHINGICKKSSFTVHVVGAELQFEADVLNKWEVFFLHLRPDIKELRVVLISPALNPSNLPLDLLGKIKLCNNCRQNKRRVVFDFKDKKQYYEYKLSEEFIKPDIVCAFNASIQRSSIYNGKDPWPSTINSVLKLRTPFVITSSTVRELRDDLQRIDECSGVDFDVISEPADNHFASVRPDRNFISDDEMPLMFKNYCFAVICGV